MPCDSSYLEPTHSEREHQRAAQLLVYVLGRLSRAAPEWVMHESQNVYACDARLFPLLCDTLRRLDAATRERLIYNAKDRTARDLADWWEDHQQADAAEAAAASEAEALGAIRRR